MKKLNKITGKVKEKAVEVKDWVSDHKAEIAIYGIATSILVGGIVLGRSNNKKYVNAWRKAKEAYDNGLLNSDFGPYKVMKFFEPTGEFIGVTMCHEDTVEMFLNIK